MVGKKGRTKPVKRPTGGGTATPQTTDTTADTTQDGGAENIGPIEPPPPPTDINK